MLASGITLATDGLRATLAAVEEDDEGITITQEWVEDDALPGLFVVMALGRFAGADLARPRFLARNQLRDRLLRTERNGGWPTLARTTVADVADHLWPRRTTWLDALDALPQVPQHGDPTPANLPGRSGDDVVAIDWANLGIGPVGADLGYFALSAREEFEPLVEAYLIGLPDDRRHAASRSSSGPGSLPSTPRSAVPSGRWRGSPGERARWPASTGTRRSRRTCGRCSVSPRRSRRC